MSDDYGLVSMKPKATANIAAGNTSDDRDIDGVADEDDDECLLLHKTMADFGLNVNPFVLSECLNGKKKPMKHLSLGTDYNNITNNIGNAYYIIYN